MPQILSFSVSRFLDRDLSISISISWCLNISVSISCSLGVGLWVSRFSIFLSGFVFLSFLVSRGLVSWSRFASRAILASHDSRLPSRISRFAFRISCLIFVSRLLHLASPARLASCFFRLSHVSQLRLASRVLHPAFSLVFASRILRLMSRVSCLASRTLRLASCLAFRDSRLKSRARRRMTLTSHASCLDTSVSRSCLLVGVSRSLSFSLSLSLNLKNSACGSLCLWVEWIWVSRSLDLSPPRSFGFSVSGCGFLAL